MQHYLFKFYFHLIYHGAESTGKLLGFFFSKWKSNAREYQYMCTKKMYCHAQYITSIFFTIQCCWKIWHICMWAITVTDCKDKEIVCVSHRPFWTVCRYIGVSVIHCSNIFTEKEYGIGTLHKNIKYNNLCYFRFQEKRLVWFGLFFVVVSQSQRYFNIYVTTHRCAGGLKKKVDLRLGSKRHWHFVQWDSNSQPKYDPYGVSVDRDNSHIHYSSKPPGPHEEREEVESIIGGAIHRGFYYISSLRRGWYECYYTPVVVCCDCETFHKYKFSMSRTLFEWWLSLKQETLTI